ncbi:polymorphic toxin-type HINT domain-containing protein, partial [Paenibacillus sp. PL2-23]
WSGPDNLFGYTGLGYDYSSGLTYARARYYQPEIGRFISEDTYKGDLWNPQSQNLYGYVHNNPLKYTDPSGMCVAGKDAGCYVDSFSGVDGLINNPQLANNSNMWWEIQRYIQKYCDDSACVAKQKAMQKKLEQGNDEIRNSVCSYVDCFDGEAKFTGTGKIQYTVDGTSSNYAVTPVGLIQCNCFTAGTTVLTDEGEKPIEEIQIGDKVLAKNDKSGNVSYQEVELLFRKTVEEIYNITVNGEVITTTAEHPFWIVGKGWVKVKDLQIGERLVTNEDVELNIQDIEVKKEHRSVYNFRVKNDHTYFVSNLKIWTHNMDSVAHC